MLTDQMIAQAAGEYMEAHIAKLEKEFENLPPHQFSKEFQRKIAKLTRRANHPVFYKVAYRAASIILAVLIGCTAWLTVDTKARAAFFGWIKETYGSYFVYRHEGNNNGKSEPVNYRITMIPDGYTEIHSKAFSDRVSVIYADDSGKMLKFNYSYNPDETDWFIKSDNSVVEKVLVNGKYAEIMVSMQQDSSSTIVWIRDGTAFNLSGFLTQKELIAIAESVQVVKK